MYLGGFFSSWTIKYTFFSFQANLKSKIHHKEMQTVIKSVLSVIYYLGLPFGGLAGRVVPFKSCEGKCIKCVDALNEKLRNLLLGKEVGSIIVSLETVTFFSIIV